MNETPNQSPLGQLILYQTEDGKTRLEVRFTTDTVWLSQSQMAELFQTTVPNVSMHIRNVFAEGELRAESVVKEVLTTAPDGKNYQTRFYSLDVIITHEEALRKARREYAKFRRQSAGELSPVEQHFLHAVKDLKPLPSKGRSRRKKL